MRDNAASIENERIVATPATIQAHAARCKVCRLPTDIKSIVNKMIGDGENNTAIVATLNSLGYPNFTADNILSHKGFFKYVCDESVVADIIAKVHGDEALRQKYLSEYEEELVLMFEEVQQLKNKELLYLWSEVIPAVRGLIGKVEANPILPVKDYASAYDILLKDALLLEGKPTGRLYVESKLDPDAKGNLKGVDKLCEILGVKFDDVKNESK